MKRLVFKMIIVSTIIISLFTACSKKDTFPDHTSGGTTVLPMTLNLTTNNWDPRGSGIWVNVFSNVLGGVNATYSIRIYLVTDGKDIQINHPISFMNGQLWATNSETDVVINYRGSSQHIPYLNIKVVLDRP